MFENIIGNDKIKETLTKSLEFNRVSHSYMFIGTEGVGKKLFAKEFAKAILCLNNQDTKTYCNNCKSCIEFDTNNNPDYTYIEPEETKIKIDQIRNIQVKVSEKPIISKNKVYIIDNADTMTIEAQNCLLKTLEEPPEYVTMIMIGTNENNFLTTIKSRCTQIHFDKIADDQIKKYLLEKFNMQTFDEKIIDIIDGSIKKAIEINQNMHTYKVLENITNEIDKCDILELLEISEEIYKAKDIIFELLDNMNTMFLKKAKENHRFANCIKVVEDTKKRLKANSNYDMCIDNLLFNIWREVN